MDMLKERIGVEATEANFIDESRLLFITRGWLELWDAINLTPLVEFRLDEFDGANIGWYDWVILRNYELDGTTNFSANPAKSGIVGIFPKYGKYRKGLVIPVSTLLKEISGYGHRTAEWNDWSRCLTVLDLPEGYELYVFHTHVLCLHRSESLRCYIFDFAPHTAGLKSNAAARGALPRWVRPLSKAPWTLPVTFSGEIVGLKPGNPSTKYFPTENGILAIEVSPISWSKSVLDV